MMEHYYIDPGESGVIFFSFQDQVMYSPLFAAYYFGMPQLSLDSMLLQSNEVIEIVNDVDMIDMLRRGLRGGVSFIGTKISEGECI